MMKLLIMIFLNLITDQFVVLKIEDYLLKFQNKIKQNK